MILETESTRIDKCFTYSFYKPKLVISTKFKATFNCKNGTYSVTKNTTFSCNFYIQIFAVH